MFRSIACGPPEISHGPPGPMWTSAEDQCYEPCFIIIIFYYYNILYSWFFTIVLINKELIKTNYLQQKE